MDVFYSQNVDHWPNTFAALGQQRRMGSQCGRLVRLSCIDGAHRLSTSHRESDAMHFMPPYMTFIFARTLLKALHAHLCRILPMVSFG